ncbi:MAG TPA: OmpH family outer membrane protein [Caulobacteraceae bacterium]|nr:OmpH family outer membrane protein [Caulobacteraceae bacterium]
MNKTLVAGALGLTLVASSALSAPPAAAPAAPRPAPAPAVAQGPAIPGVCLLSVNQAIAQSTVGGYVRTRLDQIVTQVRAELSPEETAINNEGKALDASKATLDQATMQSRANALQGRYATFQQKADQRQREVKATQDKALNRIAQELEPIAQQLYQAHRCSVLIDKGSVMLANPDMDLTPAAITALNGKIQQFPFDREHLDTGAAPAAR